MTPLTPEQMVAVKAIAPFEVQHALAAWADAARRDLDAHVERLGRELTVGDEVDARTWADGHGPPMQQAVQPGQGRADDFLQGVPF